MIAKIFAKKIPKNNIHDLHGIMSSYLMLSEHIKSSVIKPFSGICQFGNLQKISNQILYVFLECRLI